MLFLGTLPLEIALSDLMSGDNSLRIVLVDDEGASFTVSTIVTVGRPITGKTRQMNDLSISASVNTTHCTQT